MSIAREINLEDFEYSNLSGCFIPATSDGREYRVKMHANVPNFPAYMIGSIGDSHGLPESFRFLLPTPLAVGNRSTILSMTNAASRFYFPTFVAKRQNADGYNIIQAIYGAPSTRVEWLVASAWLPKPAGATRVDHLDGDPGNDTLENLAWISDDKKIQHGCRNKALTWASDDYLLMVHEGCVPRLEHPSMVRADIESGIGSHVLHYGTCKNLHGWYVCLNPSRKEAVEFVNSLPFPNISCYVEAVEEMFNSLGID